MVGTGSVLALLLMGIIRVRDQKPPESGAFNNPIVRHIFRERDKAKMRVGMMSIQSFKPESFEFFFEFIQNKEESKSDRLGQYVPYYKRIVEYYPYVPGGYEILGFCYYYLDKKEEAREVYQQAIKHHPDFFWPYYNLGVMYFQEGRYKESTAMLRKAMSFNPAEILKKMYMSRAYGEILRHASKFNYAVDQSLKESYQNSYKLMALSAYYQKNASLQNGAVFLKKNNIDVRAF